MHRIQSLQELQEHYPQSVAPASRSKVSATITPEYGRLIEASPFVALATVGPEGVDCSPRGDLAGFIRVPDPTTLLIPDRRGNNRLDSLRNLVADNRMALMFLIPGLGSILRVAGEGDIVVDEAMQESFVVDGKPARSIIVLHVRRAYFQCARAVMRSGLWDPSTFVDPKTMPTPGDMLATITDRKLGGADYDRDWTERAPSTLW